MTDNLVVIYLEMTTIKYQFHSFWKRISLKDYYEEFKKGLFRTDILCGIIKGE